MCIICVCKSKKLTDSELNESWRSNSDGAGIAWMEDGKIKYKKGFKELSVFKEFYEGFDIIPHIAHFRTSTSGSKVAELTHPFIITDDSPLHLEYEGLNSILFHNGIMSDWKDLALTFFVSNNIKIPSGVWNDTRVLAILTSRLGIRLLDFINGKFAILDPKGGIEMFGVFIEDEGNYYSNSGYKEYKYYNSLNAYNKSENVGSYNVKTSKTNDDDEKESDNSDDKKENWLCQGVGFDNFDMFGLEEEEIPTTILKKREYRKRTKDFGEKYRNLMVKRRGDWKEQYPIIISRDLSTVLVKKDY